MGGSCTKYTTGVAARRPSPPSSPDSAATPLIATRPNTVSQTFLSPSPTASSSHETPSRLAPPPATVTPDPAASPPESTEIRLQQIDPTIDRWEVPTSADTTRSSESERLGDHAATRYRHFRRVVDSKGEELDTVLFGMLLSGESLCDEIRAFEKASSLVRLAQTGYIVRKLRQLHELLDSVALMYIVRKSEEFSNWEIALKAERAERVKRYDMLLKVRLRNDEKGGSNADFVYDDLDDWDLTDKTFVQEVLTMLMAGVHKYAHDVLTQQETRTITAAFEAVSIHSNIIVLTTPAWFVSPFEFGGTYGLGRWGNDLLFRDNTDSERFIAEANIWSRLNHPHIAKFLGACHVGSRPFFAHEKVRTLTEYLSALKVTDRQAVWCRLYELALGVRYLHERGFGCGQLGLESVYCARFEDKTLLLGVGLVKSVTELGDIEVECGLRTNSLTKLVHADIRSLFLCILDALSVLASSQNEQARIVDEDAKPKIAVSDRTLPMRRPEFVTESEWSVLEPMFSGDSELSMLAVLDRLGGLAGNEERDAFDDMSSIDNQLGREVVDLGEIVVSSNGMLLREVLEQCEQLVVQEPSCAQIYARLSSVWDEVHRYDLSGMDRNEAKDMVGHVCSLIVRFYRFLYQKSTSAASSLSGWNRREPAALFSFHTGIDHWIKQYGKSMELDSIHEWQPSWHQLQSSRQSLQVQPQPAVVQSNDDEGETYCEFERMHLHTPYLKETHSCDGSANAGSGEPHIDVPKQSSLPRWLIPPYEVDYSEFDAFAKGSFGTVYRGRWFETPVVIKRVSTKGGDKRVIQQQFRREADIWFGLNHINVIKMYGACHVGQPFFVCEYASGGELMTFLEREGRNPYLMWYCLLNAALGLQYLHDANVVHGDLKANNILVGADGNVKLADFGLSLLTTSRSNQGAAGGAVGAYRWKAPECIPTKGNQGLSPTFASDVYSFAMCIIEVVSGEFPWGLIADVAVRFQVKNGKLPKRPQNLEDAEWKLIERMCCLDPSKRATIGEVVTLLSALIEHLDMEQLWPSVEGKIPFKPYNNRVISRDGALLSLLKLATSSNAWLSKLAGDHLLAVHINRGTQSGIHELERIVEMLWSESNSEKIWAARAVELLCWRNDVNRISVVAFGTIPVMVDLIRDGNDVVKERAAAALYNLSVNDKNKVSIAAAGGIPVLMNLIRDGNEVTKENAAGTLYNLSVNSDNKIAIADAGGIPVLVDMIRNGNEVLKGECAAALYNLSANDNNKVTIAAVGGISALADMIRDGNEVHKERAAAALYNLSMNDDNKVIIAAAGGIPVLVALIRYGNEVAKENAAGALYSLSINADNKVAIAAAGGIPVLVNLIRDGNAVLKENAAGALYNLSVDADNKVSIAAAGGIPTLVDLILNGNAVLIENAVGALQNLSVNDENKVAVAAAGGILVLLDLIRDGNDVAKESAAGALANLAVNDENSAAIAAAGGIHILLDLICDGNEVAKERAVGALYNLSVNYETHVSIVASGCIPTLVNLMCDGNEVVKESATGALANLTVNDENGAAIAAAGGIRVLVNLLRNGNEITKENAVGALYNLSVNDMNKASIAAAGGIPTLVILMRDGNEVAKESAAGALANLAVNDENGAAIAAAGGIPVLMNLICEGNEIAKENAVGALYNLSMNDENKVSIAAAGGIPILVNLFRDGNEGQKKLAAGALRNISNIANTTDIDAAGAVLMVVALVHEVDV